MQYLTSHIITSAPKAAKSSVLIIYTGGTLGMVPNESGLLVPFDFMAIMEHIPSLRHLGLTLTVMSFSEPMDSSNINPQHWELIGKMIYDSYYDFDGFVVLHGTDTMAYTASAISFMLQNLSKPVVFTGAQLPITSVRSDARENFITALEIASARQDGRCIVPEVCIYFDSKLLRANRAKKVESIHFNAYQSENYPLLGEAGVVIGYNYKFILAHAGKPLLFNGHFDRNVAILKLYPGITPQAVEAILTIPSLKGVIMETYGSGNAPTDRWFIDKLSAAISKGIIILNVSQCLGGRVDQTRYETGKYLQAIGVIGGADLTLEAGVTKLMLVLGGGESLARVRHKLTRALSGEMTVD